MKKQLLAWALIVIMTLAVLTACGAKQSEEPAPEPAPTTEEAAPAQEEAPAANQESGSEITEDKAKEIALKDAGVDASAAVFKKANLDFDDGVKQYEVEFYANDTEYSYDIDAASGSIISKEAEAMDAEDYQEMEALK